MGKDSGYYFCTVGPVMGTDILFSPGMSYRFNMNGAALKAPRSGGYSAHGVATDGEIAELRSRGFVVEIMDGPFRTQKEAEDVLDERWEEPD